MNRHTQAWQTQLNDGISNPNQLLRLLDLDPAAADLDAHQQFSTRIPQSFVARMEKGNLNDPLLRQVLPLAEEHNQVPGYSYDPLAELGHNPLPGLIHKYHGRVLLITTTACAINCRYCFRRHFPYQGNNPGSSGWDNPLNYIYNNPTIHEVILSGGDPLLLKDKPLFQLCKKIAQIPHVKTLRIHSRLPIVLPDRITDSLLNLLHKLPLRKVLVIHCNHPNEINDTIIASMQRIHHAGITLLNQSVLLKDINDKVETLQKLSESVFDCATLPYYLHLLDKVQGAAHFNVDEQYAKALLLALKKRLPGYLVPKLVREIASAASKETII